MSEREEAIEVLRSVIASDPYHQQFTPLMEEIDSLRQQLTTAERALDEARRERDVSATAHKIACGALAESAEQYKELRHRAERAERVVEAARAWLADLWRGDMNGTVIGVCMEYEPDGQYALWEQVAPIAEAVRALDAEAQP